MATQELGITIISAKHLKNVNWENGDLKPYATCWLDSNQQHKCTTKVDESNSIKPTWNEHFVIPVPVKFPCFFLDLNIRHACNARYSTRPIKPLVGTLRVSLRDLPDPGNSDLIRTFDIRRPSGRPNAGTIRLKLALNERTFSAHDIAMMGGCVERPLRGQPCNDYLIHCQQRVFPRNEAWYPWMRSKYDKSSAFKVKELEADDDDDDDDDDEKGKLTENRWYCKLKKLILHVCNKERKEPTDPLKKGLIMT